MPGAGDLCGPAYSLSADGQQRGDVNAADHAATLVIAKPDRLSGNVAFLVQLTNSNDVQFVAVGNPHATLGSRCIMAAVAEHEAAQISKRTDDALDAARKRGKRLGG